jgi:hypothetical protein
MQLTPQLWSYLNDEHAHLLKLTDISAIVVNDDRLALVLEVTNELGVAMPLLFHVPDVELAAQRLHDLWLVHVNASSGSHEVS